MAEARLCRTLSTSDWLCTPAASPAEPGPFSFYTRVKAAQNTTVQHRWYLNGNLLQNVDLGIAANPGEGYRTYSRMTVAAERRGNWTIELRDAAERSSTRSASSFPSGLIGRRASPVFPRKLASS